MNIHQWTEATARYGRRLVESGLAGARSGREEFLHGSPLATFLNHSARHALGPAMIGACLGALGTVPTIVRRRPARALAYGLLGGLMGLGVGFAWESRGLTESLASGAWKNLSRVRDEHWLERHPIDYA